MNRIASFSVDHRQIAEGMYISRIDEDVVTYDLRMKKPNRGDLLSNGEMHSLEHMFATLIRNSRLGDKVIYFGPMGCQTGFYLFATSQPMTCCTTCSASHAPAASSRFMIRSKA